MVKKQQRLETTRLHKIDTEKNKQKKNLVKICEILWLQFYNFLIREIRVIRG